MAINSHADLFSSAAYQCWLIPCPDSWKWLPSLSNATAVSTILAIELFQARCDAAIASCKLLMDHSSHALRNAPVNSQLLFDNKIVGGWVVRRCRVSFVTRGVQLILADSWARPAILVAGKGREVMFLFLLFLHFHSCFSFFPVPPFHLFCYLFCLFSPFLWETTQNDPQGLTCR